MKKKLGKVLLVILFAAVLLWMPVSAVMDLMNKKDLHTVRLDGAFEVLELEHSINGLIPIGTDYYYIGVEEESGDAYIIKASKKWLKNNFGSDHMSIAPEGVEVTALAKKVSDYKTSDELTSRASQADGLNYPLGTKYCLDIGYKMDAALKLVVFTLFVFLIGTGIYIFKNKGDVSPALAKCWVVVMIITVLLFIGVIR